jgi:hypothetical protein
MRAAAQPAHAPDRFAHEIVAFLNVIFGTIVVAISVGGG